MLIRCTVDRCMCLFPMYIRVYICISFPFKQLSMYNVYCREYDSISFSHILGKRVFKEPFSEISNTITHIVQHIVQCT